MTTQAAPLRRRWTRARALSVRRRLLLLTSPGMLAGFLLALTVATQHNNHQRPAALSVATQLCLLAPTVWLQIMATCRSWNAPLLQTGAALFSACAVGLGLAAIGAYTGALLTAVLLLALASPPLLQDLANALVLADFGRRSLLTVWRHAA